MLVGIEELVDEEALDVLLARHNLLVPRVWAGIPRRHLHPVERTLACQRVTPITFATPVCARCVGLADCGGQQRVITQDVVVVQVLVSQTQPVDALTQHPQHVVVYISGVTVVGETLRESVHYPRAHIQLSKQ